MLRIAAIRLNVKIAKAVKHAKLVKDVKANAIATAIAAVIVMGRCEKWK